MRTVSIDLLAYDLLDGVDLACWCDAWHIDGDDPGQVDQVDDGHLGMQHVEHDDPVSDDAAGLASEAALKRVHAILDEVVPGSRRDCARWLLRLSIVAERAVRLGGYHGHGYGRALLLRSVWPPKADMDWQPCAEGLLAREERHADELLEHRRLAGALVADDDDLIRVRVRFRAEVKVRVRVGLVA